MRREARGAAKRARGLEPARVTAQEVALVHRLIEECIVLACSKRETARVLRNLAGVPEVFTHIVWDELERQNRPFFRAYHGRAREQRLAAGRARRRRERAAHLRIGGLPIAAQLAVHFAPPHL